MPQLAEREDLFKDYCLTLQVHPEADAGMIEAAYWHLAKRYNEQADNDPLARAKLDELNEAYSVLGTPTRHEEYSRRRNEVLGEGTLPRAVEPAPDPPALAVLGRQQLRSRQTEPTPSVRKLDLRPERLIEPSWQNQLLVLLTLMGATATLAISDNVAILLVALVLAMVISATPIIRLIAKSRHVSSLLDAPEPITHLRHLGSKRPR